MISIPLRRLASHGIQRVSPLSHLRHKKRFIVLSSHSYVSLSYTRFGSTPAIIAPPVIVLHSFFESKVHWTGVATLLEQKLSPRRDIITIDLRNHGESEYAEEHSFQEMMTDIDKLVDDLDLMKVVMFGSGMGGMVAMLYALLNPSKVDRLIVEDICPFSYVDIEGLAQIIHAMRNCRIPEGTPYEKASKLAEECLRNDVKNEMLRSLILQNLWKAANGRYVWRMNLRDIEANLYNIVNFPMVHKQFLGPTLFLASTDYHLTKSVPSERLAAVTPFFPNAKITVFPNCGTYIHLERTNEFLKICAMFLH